MQWDQGRVLRRFPGGLVLTPSEGCFIDTTSGAPPPTSWGFLPLWSFHEGICDRVGGGMGQVGPGPFRT